MARITEKREAVVRPTLSGKFYWYVRWVEYEEGSAAAYDHFSASGETETFDEAMGQVVGHDCKE